MKNNSYLSSKKNNFFIRLAYNSSFLCTFAPQPKICNMAEEKFKLEDNPWLEVANMYIPSKTDCLYGENKYYCKGDKDAIENYNRNAKGTADEIITKIPSEPWWGNPLKARLIILSLNPGYVPEINKTLALLMQTNETVRRQLIEYKAKTLRLEAESFLPEEENDVNCPISCKEAVNMLGDWYWVKMLKQLKDATGLDDDKDFYRRVALVEYHGYSSQTSGRVFPRKGDMLESQVFLRKMLWHIAESRREEVCFLVMRGKKEWAKLLSQEFFDVFNVVEKKPSSMISQYITPANFEDGKYEEILKILR